MSANRFICGFCGEKYMSASGRLEVTFQGTDDSPKIWDIGHKECADTVKEKVRAMMNEVDEQ